MDNDRPVWRPVAATCPTCEHESIHELDVGAIPAVAQAQCPACGTEYEVRLAAITRPRERRLRDRFDRGLRLAR